MEEITNAENIDRVAPRVTHAYECASQVVNGVTGNRYPCNCLTKIWQSRARTLPPSP